MKTYRTSDPVHLSSKVSAAMFRMTLSTKAAFRPSFRFVRFSAFIVSVAIIAAASYSASSASSFLFASGGSLPKSASAPNPVGMLKVANGSVSPTTAYSLITETGGGSKFLLSATGLYPALALPPPPDPESIATYAADCITQKTDFNLGEAVCAKATGVPSLLFPYRVSWIGPDGLIAQSETASTDPDTHYTYSPTTAGTWRVNLTRSSGAVRQSAVFTVHDTANLAADVFVQKFVRDGNASVPAGNNIAFILIVGNAGPDTAANVNLIDSVPSGSTLVSFTQQSGSACTPTGTGNCTMSLANGERAEFTAIYNTGSSAPGTVVTTSASVSNTPSPDPDTSNNTSIVQFQIDAASGAGTCSLTCPPDITTTANTTESGQRGAHVTFADAASSGDCGAVSSSPPSGSFFPVGTTSVHSTSETGGGTCNFTVTVEDTQSAVTISCPSNKEANADSDCAATVVVGTATATGDNVTITGARSDGKPMYTCDVNGTNCTRRSSDDPFSAGVTTITWTAYSHDTPGPYASPDDEEAHRTGSASCTQTVTVNDTIPPTITPPPSQTASADATCQAAVPDFTTNATVTDNCACASSDTSDACVDRQRITVTQDPAPGTIVGLGSHTITLTANDGSSNNSGAGNTSTATTTFTVNDTTAPIVTCPANITRSNDAGQCSAAINPGTATATDNCDANPTVTGTRSDGQSLSAPYPVGTTTVTWTATDVAGNHSSCTQAVIVNDTENPTITAPPNVTAFTGPGATTCGTVVDPGTASAHDNCPGVTVSRIPSGNTFPVGTTTVTWTATDAHGNTATATQTVTVIDNTPPTISCQADIVVDFNPAVNGATVNYTAPVGTDNCAGATTTRTAGLASGSTFPAGTTTNTFRVTDAAGNTAQCSFKVTVALTSIIGLDSVSISGAALVDSYNSTGGYPATKGNLANVLSNGTITLANSGKVAGNVRSTRAGVAMSGASQVTGNATAGTTVSRSGSATVGGTITNNALAPVMTMPSVPACGPPYSPATGITGTYSYNQSTGDLSLSGVNIATLANGTYCFHNVTLTNSAQLKVNGLVVIKLTGTLNASGATSFTNTTGTPGNLRILSSYTGTTGVIFGNSTNVHLVIYAPGTGVSISGAAPLFGTVVGKTVTIGNSGMLHYDTQLKNIWPEIWSLIP